MATTTIGIGGDKRWSLVGTTALITGGTRGIGVGIVEELAGFGASIYTCWRSQKDLDQRLQEWKSKGYVVSGSVCDLQSPSQRDQLMKSVASEFCGNLNILVNNAGTIVVKETTEFTAQDFSSITKSIRNWEHCVHFFSSWCCSFPD
ncbi:Tropinone reductase [Heracleum sosnowskyi]|uniref:Tropinone reductase n=1 Tax=Heracleum sosnowskyi TaxID=360622 RepID=A0AAD8NAP1_9APIA|nr:Tropinone reductase [Heracleum sosnowskyi]